MSGTPEKVERKNFRLLSDLSRRCIPAPPRSVVCLRNLALLSHYLSRYPCCRNHLSGVAAWQGHGKMVKRKGVGNET